MGRHFNKRARDIDELVYATRERGVDISNEAQARHYLRHIGFYRLSGYMPPSPNEDGKDSNHYLDPPVPFEQVLDLYIFDRKLRLLSMDAIERIEVAVRSLISDTMSVWDNDPHWYLESGYFQNWVKHNDFVEDVEWAIGLNKPKKRTKFIARYLEAYSEPHLPPSWMIFEVLTFCRVSEIYSWLKHEYQREIACELGMDAECLRKWLEALVNIRNVCAHHNRLWNARFDSASLYHEQFANYLYPNRNNSFYPHAVVMQVLLKKVTEKPHWNERLYVLLDQYRDIPLQMMGFPKGKTWYRLPLWDVKPGQYDHVFGEVKNVI